MVFSNEDKILMKTLGNPKARKFTEEFPNWNRKWLDYLLKKLRETGTMERKVGSGSTHDAEHRCRWRPHRQSRSQTQNTSVHTADCTRNWCVTEFCRTDCQQSLSLKCFKRCRAQELREFNSLARLVRSPQLLKRYQEHDVAFVWITDDVGRLHTGKKHCN